MTPKIILDLCGGTGAWSKPYKEAGYDVRLITLPDNDVMTYKPPPGVYGIVAAPPCTEFSKAKGSLPRNHADAIKVIEACLHIVWQCRIEGSLKFWALENPTGQLRQFLGHPPYYFQPWWFGDFHTKRTDIWGYFEKPRRKFTNEPLLLHRSMISSSPKRYSDQTAWRAEYDKQWANPKCPPEYKHLKLDRAAIRAITPEGFARAFFRANK